MTATLTGAAARMRKLITDHAGDTALYLVGRDRSRHQLYAWQRHTESWIPVPRGGAAATTIATLTSSGAVTLTRLAETELPPDLARAIRRHELKPWRGLGNVQRIHLPTPGRRRPFPYRAFPCAPCPIRADNADNPAAKFPKARWDALSRTLPDPQTGIPPMPHEPMFGCHKGKPGSEEHNPQPQDDLACAGWLARFGHNHLAVRMALIDGRLDPAALEPGDNWPPLHKTWDDVVRHQTSDTNSCPVTTED